MRIRYHRQSSRSGRFQPALRIWVMHTFRILEIFGIRICDTLFHRYTYTDTVYGYHDVTQNDPKCSSHPLQSAVNDRRCAAVEVRGAGATHKGIDRCCKSDPTIGRKGSARPIHMLVKLELQFGPGRSIMIRISLDSVSKWGIFACPLVGLVSVDVHSIQDT